jgi:hypothetical protein
MIVVLAIIIIVGVVLVVVVERGFLLFGVVQEFEVVGCRFRTTQFKNILAEKEQLDACLHCTHLQATFVTLAKTRYSWVLSCVINVYIIAMLGTKPY